MADSTPHFLNATDAAEKLQGALGELKEQTEGYLEAREYLETASGRIEELAEVAGKSLNETNQQLDTMKDMLSTMKDTLNSQGQEARLSALTLQQSLTKLGEDSEASFRRVTRMVKVCSYAAFVTALLALAAVVLLLVL